MTPNVCSPTKYPTVTLSKTRNARYSTPPSSSRVMEARSMVGSLRGLSSLRRCVLAVLPSTNMDDTARSTDFALLMVRVFMLLVSDRLRRRV